MTNTTLNEVIQSKNYDQVLSTISKEVRRARRMWGTGFDDKNTLNDWIVYTNIYTGKASEMGANSETVRRNLYKAAGVLVSALERLETNGQFPPRHYDGEQRPTSLPEVINERK